MTNKLFSFHDDLIRYMGDSLECDHLATFLLRPSQSQRHKGLNYHGLYHSSREEGAEEAFKYLSALG